MPIHMLNRAAGQRAAWLLIFLVLLVACNGSEGETAPEAGLGEPFVLAVGETVVIANEDLRLTFTAVLEDSRCPTEVECFWAGQARLAVGAQVGNAPVTELEFNSNPNTEDSFQNHTVDGYLIELQTLEPYPDQPEAIQTTDYRLTLVVTKSGR